MSALDVFTDVEMARLAEGMAILQRRSGHQTPFTIHLEGAGKGVVDEVMVRARAAGWICRPGQGTETIFFERHAGA